MEDDMHASIWKFTGDPDDLAQRYDALIAELPTDEFIAHLCLRTPDGLVIVDVCPTEEAYRAFSTGPGFREARRRHGIPDPTELHDYPVHAAFVDGAQPALRA
jgi:hypothetical protein